MDRERVPEGLDDLGAQAQVRGRRVDQAQIVGPNPDELWETARGSQVAPTHLAALAARGERIVRVYRMGA